ncbi:hypothetical protein VHEMI02173 [[Torrubiella] hemipterigena]|uniref:Uncharacterized protein n=1 Tax=[Torrubiella] hemipterigena TaxID=1531966 RepID=A0A0A1SNU6_9HYPO|nr:hypothetical protein VHEMI02173 [[Torrubiella] hemipterigena]
MKFNVVFSTLVMAPLAVYAAPVEAKRELNLGGLGPLAGTDGVTSAGQEAIAEVFKAGDAVLNIPGDAVNSLMSGRPDQAVQGAASGIVKTLGSLPGDAAKIMGALTKGN